jgi:uncharacterized protein
VARVVHFEIQVDNIERAKAFYDGVFEWTFQDWSEVTGSPYWGIITGPDDEQGINGGLLQRSTDADAPGSGVNGFVCTIEVDDYDVIESRIIAAGGEVVSRKAALAGMAWQGYYLDSEGNTFGIHQSDPEAK